jgi:hypothetical protein
MLSNLDSEPCPSLLMAEQGPVFEGDSGDLCVALGSQLFAGINYGSKSQSLCLICVVSPTLKIPERDTGAFVARCFETVGCSWKQWKWRLASTPTTSPKFRRQCLQHRLVQALIQPFL